MTLLPPNLAGDGRVAYQGLWIAEVRDAAVTLYGGTRRSREIWVRTAGGQDRRWVTNDGQFGALEGHRVGVLAFRLEDGEEALLGMVNYDTGEMRLLSGGHSGFGWKIWLAYFGLLLLVEGGDPWRMYAWLAGLILLVGASVYSAISGLQLGERDRQRLIFLKDLEWQSAELVDHASQIAPRADVEIHPGSS